MMTQANETTAATKDTASRRFLRRTIAFLFPLSVLREKTSDPHKALENLERVSGAATLWILWGIIIELGALFWFSRNRVEMFIGIVANALIAFGLIFEYVAIGRTIIVSGEAQRHSDEKIAALEVQAASAQKEAAFARVEQEQLKAQFAWRTLTIAATQNLEKILSAQPGSVNIEYVANDPEALYFAIQLSNVFGKAKWKVASASITAANLLTLGIFVPPTSSIDTMIVRKALHSVGVAFSTDALAAGAMMRMGSTIENAAIIFIGSKLIPGVVG